MLVVAQFERRRAKAAHVRRSHVKFDVEGVGEKTIQIVLRLICALTGQVTMLGVPRVHGRAADAKRERKSRRKIGQVSLARRRIGQQRRREIGR